MTKRLLLLVALLLVPGVASAQTTWSINPTTGTVILDNVTITDTLMELGATVDLQLDKQATGGAAQCLQVGSTGLVTKTGSACGGTGSSPGGADTNVQYNSSGTFAGDASFTFASGSKKVTLFDLIISDQATGGAAQCLQIDTSGNVTKTGSACSTSAGTVTHTGGLTLHAPIIGNGTADIKATAVLTNGQLLIGSTGADPVPAAIGSSTLTITTGAGSLSLDTASIATHQLVVARGAGPYVGLGSLGTTTTVLHGNAAGDPTFGAVNASTDMTGILSVANGGLGLASGTTGGIPYFTSTTTMSSSLALQNHALVIGGGSAQPPHTDGALIWDDTNHRLGIGTASPATQLQITADITALGLTLLTTNPRQIVTENASSAFGNATDWHPYERMILNDTTNAQKSGFYIENVSAGTVFSLTSLTSSSNTATATTSSPHNLRTGDQIVVFGALPTAYNVNNVAIIVTGAQTFTYTVAGPLSSPATGTITAEQSRTQNGIAIFSFSQADNGHDVSGITSVEWGNGNAATFIKATGAGPGGLPALTDAISRQYGFAIEVDNFSTNGTSIISSTGSKGIAYAAGVGNGAGPPWAEGLRIYPQTDQTNLDSRIAIIVGTDQDNLNQTADVSFRVFMNGATFIQNNSGISNQLTVEGLGTNGANLLMIGNGGGSDRKTLRVAGGLFQMLDSAYTNVLFQMNDAGTSPAFPQLTGAGNASLCIGPTGTVFRGSPGC